MEEIIHKKGKIYYSMGEVAEMFDENPSLIRFWEKKFDILKPHKNKKGNRLFTPQDVDNLRLIYHLVKEKGMTLAGAQKALQGNREGAIRDMEIADRLLSIKAMLVEIREELKTDGEAISPEGYLDEESTDAGSAAGTSAEEPTDEGFTLLAEEVRIEVVTDGSSPWAQEEDEEEPGEPEEDAAGDENDAPGDPTQREAAMEELRNIKSILDSWDDLDETAAGGTAATGIEETADTLAGSFAASGPDPAPGGPFGMDDREEDYSDPWEEAAEEPVGSETFDPETPAGGRPLPGDLFGTDACTTFSDDDREAMAETEEKEQPQRPAIYEQTLF